MREEPGPGPGPGFKAAQCSVERCEMRMGSTIIFIITIIIIGLSWRPEKGASQATIRASTQPVWGQSFDVSTGSGTLKKPAR